MIRREKQSSFRLLLVGVTMLIASANATKMSEGSGFVQLGYYGYGEPTVFVIKRTNNRSRNEEEHLYSRQNIALGPTGKFEPRFPMEFVVLIVLVLGVLILCTIIGNVLVVAAIFLEKNLQVRSLRRF